MSRQNDLIQMPASIYGRYHNGQITEPCDMIEGPCACGAWHHFYEWDPEIMELVIAENPWVEEHRFSVMGCHLVDAHRRKLEQEGRP